MENDKHGNYVWLTYNQVYTRMRNFGSGLLQTGLKSGMHFGLYAINSPEWIIAEQTCYMYNFITVPVYDTLQENQLQYILDLTELTTMITTSDKALRVLELHDRLPLLKTVIIIDTVPRIVQEQAYATHINVMTMRDVEKMGRENPLPKKATKRDDIATICFTSGTLENPKGVLLTHGNLLSFVASVCKLIEQNEIPSLDAKDIHFSYLSLSHIFERAVSQVLTFHGSKIGFYHGDSTKLLDDIQLLKPTIFSSVPRFYNKLFQSITTSLDHGNRMYRYFFKKAYQAKIHSLQHGTVEHSMWDLLVFKPIRKRLGGNVRMMISGAAPVAPHITDFMRICFSTCWIEGYGSTETSAAATLTLQSDKTHGHVGVPLANCIIKLKDVPEMDCFTHKDPPSGQIFVKGFNICQGYYKDSEKTSIL
jgi:long-chain acyl-CoA synthetase